MQNFMESIVAFGLFLHFAVKKADLPTQRNIHGSATANTIFFYAWPYIQEIKVGYI